MSCCQWGGKANAQQASFASAITKDAVAYHPNSFIAPAAIEHCGKACTSATRTTSSVSSSSSDVPASSSASASRSASSAGLDDTRLLPRILQMITSTTLPASSGCAASGSDRETVMLTLGLKFLQQMAEGHTQQHQVTLTDEQAPQRHRQHERKCIIHSQRWSLVSFS